MRTMATLVSRTWFTGCPIRRDMAGAAVAACDNRGDDHSNATEPLCKIEHGGGGEPCDTCSRCRPGLRFPSRVLAPERAAVSDDGDIIARDDGEVSREIEWRAVGMNVRRVALPDAPGIGFERKAALWAVMKDV